MFCWHAGIVRVTWPTPTQSGHQLEPVTTIIDIVNLTGILGSFGTFEGCISCISHFLRIGLNENASNWNHPGHFISIIVSEEN